MKRKIFSLVIALVFLLSAVTPAMAASCAGEEDSGTLLQSLGVIEGYEDGTLGLDKTITRAEMSVVLAKIAGLNGASSVLKDVPSKFSDVKTGVWYTGYINLASTKGWVKGYPDGTFKPTAPVTYAEAVTMLMNVLGYGKGTLPGTWPQNYIVKAAELGVTDGIDYASGTAATRGCVFVLAENCLSEEFVNWDSDDSEFYGAGEDLIERLASGETDTITINDAYMMVGSGLDDDDREVSNGEIEAVAAGFNVAPYVGIPSSFYLNDDDEIIAVKDTDLDKVATDDIALLNNDELVLDNDDDDTWDIDPNAVIIVNDEIVDLGDDVLDIERGTVEYLVDETTVASVEDDRVIYAKVVDYDSMDSMLVDGVDVDDNEVSIDEKAGEGLTLDTDEDQIAVYGDAASLEDIEEYDVLYWNQEGDDYALYVVRDSASGEADRYTNSSLRVDGVTYDYEYYYGSTDDGDTWSDMDSGDIAQFSEEDVTVYIDGYGDIYALSAPIVEGAENVAMLVGDVEANESWGSWEYRVDLFTAAGDEVTYYFEDDEIGGDAYEAFEAGDLVEFSLNEDGEIDLFDAYDAETTTCFLIDEDYTIDYNRVEGCSVAGKYYATNDTVIINADPDSEGAPYEDAELMDWADVEAWADGQADYHPNALIWANDDNDIEYMIFYAPVDEATVDYAVYVDSWYVGDDAYVSYIDADGLHESMLEDPADVEGLEEGDIVQVVGANGDVEIIDMGTTDSGTLIDGAYNDDRGTLEVDGYAYDTDADTFVIDVTGDDPVVIDLGDLEEDDYVTVYAEDGDLLNVVVLMDEPVL